MSLQIDWVEKVQTKTGKEYVKVTIQNQTMACWPWKVSGAFYASRGPGAGVDGVIAQDGQYKSSVEAPDANSDGLIVQPRPVVGYNRGNGIAKAQETKRADIEMAQTVKENNVKNASVNSGARDLVIAFYPELAELPSPDKEIKIEQCLDMWRDKLANKWYLGF